MTIVTLDDTLKVNATIHYKEDYTGQLIDVSSSITLPDGQLAIYRYQNKAYTINPTDSIPIIIGPYGTQIISQQELKQTGDTIIYQSYSPDLNRVITYTRIVTGIQIINAKKHRLVDEYSNELPYSRLILDAKYQLSSSNFNSPLGAISISKFTPKDSIVALYDQSLSNPSIRSNTILPDPANINAIEVKVMYEDTVLIKQIADNSFSPTPIDSIELIKAKSSNAWVLSDSLELFSVADSLTIELNDEKQIADTLADYCDNESFDHPTLQLIAMARSIGIQARITRGYYYQSGHWVPSYWTQIGIDGEWIDYHLGYNVPNQALTIPLFTSYLENGFTELSSQTPQNITITSFLSQGHTKHTNQTSPYSIDHDRLKISGIGLSVQLPEGFTMDSSYIENNKLIQLQHLSQKIIVEYHSFTLNTAPTTKEFISSLSLEDSKKNNPFKFDHLMTNSNSELLIAIPQGDSFILIRGVNLKKEGQEIILGKKSIQLRY